MPTSDGSGMALIGKLMSLHYRLARGSVPRLARAGAALAGVDLQDYEPPTALIPAIDDRQLQRQLEASLFSYAPGADGRLLAAFTQPPTLTALARTLLRRAETAAKSNYSLAGVALRLSVVEKLSQFAKPEELAALAEEMRRQSALARNLPMSTSEHEAAVELPPSLKEATQSDNGPPSVSAWVVSNGRLGKLAVGSLLACLALQIYLAIEFPNVLAQVQTFLAYPTVGLLFAAAFSLCTAALRKIRSR